MKNTSKISLESQHPSSSCIDLWKHRGNIAELMTTSPLLHFPQSKSDIMGFVENMPIKEDVYLLKLSQLIIIANKQIAMSNFKDLRKMKYQMEFKL